MKRHLPDPTTVHWHGLPVPNAMDGVPNITQKPIAPGGSFVYDFVAGPPGTYMYHSHVGLQLDRGLIGPLIVEEKSPQHAYDREYVVALDDFLPAAPKMPEARGRRGMGRMGMMGGAMPPYAALLINGRLPESPATFRVRKGDRIRLRFITPSGSTTYRVALAGHRMTVTHTDGRPVKPVEVDSFFIGMGERTDVLVEARNPGAWSLMAASVRHAHRTSPRDRPL